MRVERASRGPCRNLRFCQCLAKKDANRGLRGKRGWFSEMVDIDLSADFALSAVNCFGRLMRYAFLALVCRRCSPVRPLVSLFLGLCPPVLPGRGAEWHDLSRFLCVFFPPVVRFSRFRRHFSAPVFSIVHVSVAYRDSRLPAGSPRHFRPPNLPGLPGAAGTYRAPCCMVGGGR